MQTERQYVAKGDHVHTIMCSQKTNTKTHWAVTIAHRWWPVAWAWTPTSACIQSRSTNLLCNCTITLLEEDHNLCAFSYLWHM